VVLGIKRKYIHIQFSKPDIYYCHYDIYSYARNKVLSVKSVYKAHYPVMALVYLLISWLLHSNRSTCYSMLQQYKKIIQCWYRHFWCSLTSLIHIKEPQRKINVFWNVISFRLVNVNQCFGGTSVNFNQTTWHHTPNGNNLLYSLLLDPTYLPMKHCKTVSNSTYKTRQQSSHWWQTSDHVV
jgi:hypothetical protein